MTATGMAKDIDKRVDAKMKALLKKGWDESPGGQFVVTPKTAARELGITRKRLDRLIWCGTVMLVQIAGCPMVPRSEIARLRRRIAG